MVIYECNTFSSHFGIQLLKEIILGFNWKYIRIFSGYVSSNVQEDLIDILGFICGQK